VDQDAELIADMYRRAGFEKAEVEASSRKDASGRNIVVTFTVKEGLQSRVAEVVMHGNQAISYNVNDNTSILASRGAEGSFGLDVRFRKRLRQKHH
jgi:outer membrane protein assembly factor BamA